MDDLDIGVFNYNMLLYPSCIETSFNNTKTLRPPIDDIIKKYIKGSTKKKKHHRNILPSGMDVGEAAVFCVVNGYKYVDSDRVLTLLVNLIQSEFDINCTSDSLKNFVDLTMFHNNRYKRQLSKVLKNYLSRYHCKRVAGCSKKVRNICAKVTANLGHWRIAR